MLKQNANETFNKDAIVSWMMRGMKKAASDMHPQMQRLYLAAKILRKREGQSEVARLLGVMPQGLNSWEKRGISAKGMVDAAQTIGCSLMWLRDGTGEMEGAFSPTKGDLQDVISLLSYYGRLPEPERELVLRFAKSLLPEG